MKWIGVVLLSVVISQASRADEDREALCKKAGFGLVMMGSYTGAMRLSAKDIVSTSPGVMGFQCRDMSKFKVAADVHKALGEDGVIVRDADPGIGQGQCRVAYLSFEKFIKVKSPQGFDVTSPVWRVIKFEKLNKALGGKLKNEAALLECGRK